MNTIPHPHGPRRSLWKTPALVTALILLIPLLGNCFIDGWHWELRGFILAGTLIFAVCLTYQLVARNVNTSACRPALAVALATMLVLVWLNFIQAADDINPDAMMYLWVPLVGIMGAALARLRPVGMARALFVTALAQALVLTIALITRDPPAASWTPAVWRGFGLNAFFIMLFAGSAALFRKAARAHPSPRTA